MAKKPTYTQVTANTVNLSRYRQQDLSKFKRTNLNGFPNGTDNLYPDYLDGLYNASPTHQGIINDLVGYIVGKGLHSDNAESQAKIDRLFPNKKLSKIIRLDVIHNAKTLEILKNDLYEIKEINVLLPKQIRVSELVENEPKKFIYREDWRPNSAGYKPIAPLVRYEKGIQSKESLFYEYDSRTFPVPYGRPYYMSGTDAIEMEASIYLANNHASQNGMFPSMIIDRETSGKEGEDFTSTREIVQAAAGAASAGKIIDVKRPQGSQPLNITVPATSGIDKLFDTLYAKAEAGITKAHGLPSQTLIAGLNIKPTGFGDAEEEMQWALDQWKSKKINPYRQDFLDDLKPLFDELGIVDVEFLDSTEVDTSSLEPEQELSTNSVLRGLTGREFQGLERVVKKFKQGKLGLDQATMMLKRMYGLTDEEAALFLNTTSRDFTKMKAEVGKNRMSDVELDGLIELGDTEQELIDGGFVLADVRDVNYDDETLLDEHIKDHFNSVKLANTGRARGNQKSVNDGVEGDTQYKIRYRYSGNESSKSRSFCSKMVRAKKIYRKEDIDQMSFSGANAGFGIRGARNYSIFQWKGGIYCHHKWERLTFVKEGLEGSIDVNSPIAERNALNVNEAESRGIEPKNEPAMVSIRPIDTSSRGRVTFSSLESLIKKGKTWLSNLH